MMKNLKDIQPWEAELARQMCCENLSLLQSEIHIPNVKAVFDNTDPQKQKSLIETAYTSYDELLKQREEMMDTAVGIIREVQVDSEGNRILTPQEWLDKTADMTDEEKEAFSAVKTVTITDMRKGFSYEVPMSLTENFKRLFDVGIRQASVLSGRVADEPNRRDRKGFPYALSALARPLCRLDFDIRDVPGSKNSLTHAQIRDVKQAAAEAGWCVGNLNGKSISLMLPLTKSGLSAEALAERVIDKLDNQQPGWRVKEGWTGKYIGEFNSQLIEQGGRIMYSDRDLEDAWNRLTAAIVQKTLQRWDKEQSRITDIQVSRKLNTTLQTVEHSIRCRIDGIQQMAVPLHKLDGGRYDKAVYLGEKQPLEELKTELAHTYFSKELQNDRSENCGMKR